MTVKRRDTLLGSAALLATASLPRLSCAATQGARMTLYRDPHCGCCMSWVATIEKTYPVSVIPTNNMAEIKQQLGVPADLVSCHTGQIGTIVIEGHVPLADIERLLADKPEGVRGLAVPGMPLGSPGMEHPDGHLDPYTVFAFYANGDLRAFSRHNGA